MFLAVLTGSLVYPSCYQWWMGFCPHWDLLRGLYFHRFSLCMQMREFIVCCCFCTEAKKAQVRQVDSIKLRVRDGSPSTPPGWPLVAPTVQQESARKWAALQEKEDCMDLIVCYHWCSHWSAVPWRFLTAGGKGQSSGRASPEDECVTQIKSYFSSDWMQVLQWMKLSCFRRVIPGLF